MVWSPLWLPALSGISIPEVSTDPWSMLIAGLWIVGVLAVPVFAVGLLLLLQGYMNRDREEGHAKDSKTDKTKPDGKAKRKSWPARVTAWLYEVRNHPVLFMFYIPAGWFVFTGILWVFRKPMSEFGWPSDGLSAWEWLRWQNKELFWATPFIILVGFWFVRAEAKALKATGYLIWTPLILLWVIVLFRVTTDSNTWIDYWAGDSKVEAGRRADTTGPGHEVRIAESGYWSEPVYVNGKRFSYDIDGDAEDRQIWVRVNGTRVVKDQGDGRYDELGSGIKTLEFRTVDGHPPVQVITTIK